jgi:TolB-like protein
MFKIRTASIVALTLTFSLALSAQDSADNSNGEQAGNPNTEAVSNEQILQQMNDSTSAPQPADDVPAVVSTGDTSEAAGFDVQMRRLSDAMALGLKRLPGDHRDQLFAVFTFTDVGEEAQQRQLGLVVSDHIINDLYKFQRLNLVERGALQNVIAEQGLALMGLVEDSQAVSVGKLAGARALVVGQVTDKGDSFQIAGRVVDATTGEVFVSELVEVEKAELVAFSANAVVLRSKGAAAIRSVLIPGWGQFYNQQKVKAAFIGGTFATMVVATGVSAALAYSTHQTYSNFTPEGFEEKTEQKVTESNQQDIVAGLREQANTQYSVAGVFGAASGIMWLFGIADAYLSGIDVDSLDDAMADR